VSEGETGRAGLGFCRAEREIILLTHSLFLFTLTAGANLPQYFDHTRPCAVGSSRVTAPIQDLNGIALGETRTEHSTVNLQQARVSLIAVLVGASGHSRAWLKKMGDGLSHTPDPQTLVRRHFHYTPT
jgi:hypothetical protein